MQAVLLAAGKGTRLLPETEHIPKCMVAVAGKPLVDHLLAGLERVGVSELVVVTGYKPSALEKHLRDSNLPVKFVSCPDFATTNNIVSLKAAAPLIRPPFLLLESDVYAEPAVYEKLTAPDSALVAPYDATMDGTGVLTNPDGSIREMVLGAHTVTDLQGSDELQKTVNFYHFSDASWRVIRPALFRWIEEGKVQSYYEAVIAETIGDGSLKLSGRSISGFRWQEIDDLADLAKAEALLEQKQ